MIAPLKIAIITWVIMVSLSIVFSYESPSLRQTPGPGFHAVDRMGSGFKLLWVTPLFYEALGAATKISIDIQDMHLWLGGSPWFQIPVVAEAKMGELGC